VVRIASAAAEERTGAQPAGELILLGTSVIFETTRPTRSVARLDDRDPETLHLAAVNLAVLVLGIALLAVGQRKAQLALTVASKVVDSLRPAPAAPRLISGVSVAREDVRPS
jgi:hypothetical protein